MNFKHYIINQKMINEGLSLDEGAVEWDELTSFYKHADEGQKKKMVELVIKEDWMEFKKLIYKVIKNI